MKYLTPPPSDLVDLKFKEEWFEESLISKYNTYMNDTEDAHIKDIISLLNVTIKRIVIAGYTGDTVNQQQGGGVNHVTQPFLGSKSWVQALSSKTVTITMHHTDSYMTWLFLWESYQRQYSASNKNTKHDSLQLNILNTKRQHVFSFTFRDFIFSNLDDIELDAETQNNSFGTFDIVLEFATGNVIVDMPTNQKIH